MIPADPREKKKTKTKHPLISLDLSENTLSLPGNDNQTPRHEAGTSRTGSTTTAVKPGTFISSSLKSVTGTERDHYPAAKRAAQPGSLQQLKNNGPAGREVRSRRLQKGEQTNHKAGSDVCAHLVFSIGILVLSGSASENRPWGGAGGAERWQSEAGRRYRRHLQMGAR